MVVGDRRRRRRPRKGRKCVRYKTVVGKKGKLRGRRIKRCAKWA